MVENVVQVLALLTTLESAFFLAEGNLGLTAKDIAKLAGDYYNYSPTVAKNLAGQRADTWAGMVLLPLPFLLQSVNAILPIDVLQSRLLVSYQFVAILIGGLVFPLLLVSFHGQIKENWGGGEQHSWIGAKLWVSWFLTVVRGSICPVNGLTCSPIRPTIPANTLPRHCRQQKTIASQESKSMAIKRQARIAGFTSKRCQISSDAES
jgi:hypothetical protein